MWVSLISSNTIKQLVLCGGSQAMAALAWLAGQARRLQEIKHALIEVSISLNYVDNSSIC
jgi:hypothetical protein